MTFCLVDGDFSGFFETTALLGAPNRGYRRLCTFLTSLRPSAAHKRVGSSQLRSFGLPASDWKGES
ncbi:hypothetical protein FHT78_001425 [Rhizobium sp. BK196]|nr:hypothetical protein [Rhizobium sp. BK196]MBB3462968.1 hypothetical protein [Rhizobium sp. BK377]